jgi:hypothetical protein
MFFSSRPSCPFTIFFGDPGRRKGVKATIFLLSCFFWTHPWPQFFLGTSYLPLQPTYHPSSYQPTYLLHAIDLHC